MGARPTALRQSSEATPSSLDEETNDTIRLTRAQLQAHLARPGCLTDRLDHPLLLARSGILMFDPIALGRISALNESRDSEYVLQDDRWEPHEGDGDYVDLFSVSDLGPHVNENIGPRDSLPSLDPAVSSAATLGSCLALTRSIFAFAPSLCNLSLTSFLGRAVCGNRPPSALKALRYLSLGPHLPYWNLGLHLDAAAIANVEKLRLCGYSLCTSEEASIAGDKGSLPHLKELRFVLPETEGWLYEPKRGGSPPLGDGGHS